MAWPPTLPSTVDVTNTTPTLNRHAPDHNLIADALADIVTRGASTAWGIIPNGLAQVVANQLGIASNATPGTAITGASCAVTTLAGRRYRIQWLGQVQGSASGGTAVYTLVRDGTIIQRRTFYYALSATPTQVNLFLTDVPTAGAHTYTVNVWRGTGSGTIDQIASAQEVSELTVMDIGPTVPT